MAGEKALGRLLAKVLRKRSVDLDLDEAELAKLEAGDPDTLDGLLRLINRSPSFVEDVVKAVSDEALAFVREEVTRLSTIKQSRELTEDELRFGREELPSILDSLAKLVSR